jgi:hypothetical protein
MTDYSVPHSACGQKHAPFTPCPAQQSSRHVGAAPWDTCEHGWTNVGECRQVHQLREAHSRVLEAQAAYTDLVNDLTRAGLSSAAIHAAMMKPGQPR